MRLTAMVLLEVALEELEQPDVFQSCQAKGTSGLWKEAPVVDI